jgi:hypothetical protein
VISGLGYDSLAEPTGQSVEFYPCTSLHFNWHEVWVHELGLEFQI